MTERKSAEIIPYDVFAQHRLNRHNLKHPDKPLTLPKPVPLVDEDFDDDVPVMDRALLWGDSTDYAERKKLLTRHFEEQGWGTTYDFQTDPGDER